MRLRERCHGSRPKSINEYSLGFRAFKDFGASQGGGDGCVRRVADLDEEPVGGVAAPIVEWYRRAGEES